MNNKKEYLKKLRDNTNKISKSLIINKHKHKKKEEYKIIKLRKILFQAIKINNPTTKNLFSNKNKIAKEIHYNSRCSTPN